MGSSGAPPAGSCSALAPAGEDAAGRADVDVIVAGVGVPVPMVAEKGTTPLGDEMHGTAGVGGAAGTHGDVDVDVAAGRIGSAHGGCADD